jgi:HEAT repeats
MVTADLEQAVEDVIAFADTVPHGDDELWERVDALVRRDLDAAAEIGERLLASDVAERREMGIRLIGIAGVLEDYRFRERAKPLIREALRRETEPGPILWAITQLGHLCDGEAVALAISHARDADPEVRESLAAALPMMSLTDDRGTDPRALAVLRDLTTDEDGDVRDWATFGIGTQDDTDDEITRQALFARLEDQHPEARMEAIVGLARRRDERVRPYLMRELAHPDHGDIFDDALEVLEGGYNWQAIEPAEP